MSQFNPQTRNFIRDYMTQRSQIVDYFLSSIHRLYRTGDWTKSYRPTLKTAPNSQKKYNPNFVVNLSMLKDSRNEILQSYSSQAAPNVHLSSLNSQLKPMETPKGMNERDLNANISQLQSPLTGIKTSPIKNFEFNPVGGHGPRMEPPIMNQRYGCPVEQTPDHLSLIENQLSLNTSNLLNELLQKETNFLPNHGNNNPVVPEFQQQIVNNIPETTQIQSHPQQQPQSHPQVQPHPHSQPQPQAHPQAQEYDEIPIKPQKAEIDPFSQSQEQPGDFMDSSQAIAEAPKYDFEEILKKALQEQEGNQVQEVEEQPKAKRKAKFLKRKKKYDPREAIKNEKIKKKNQKKRHKSAFPQGFLKTEEEQDEDTSEMETAKAKKLNRSKSKPKKSKTKENIQTESDNNQDNENEDSDSDFDEGQMQNEENKKKIKPKPFLKRKTKGVQFHKVNWNNVKSKTD